MVQNTLIFVICSLAALLQFNADSETRKRGYRPNEKPVITRRTSCLCPRRRGGRGKQNPPDEMENWLASIFVPICVRYAVQTLYIVCRSKIQVASEEG